MKKVLFLAGLVAVPVGLVVAIAALGGFEAGANPFGTTLALLLVGAGISLGGLQLMTVDVKEERKARQ